MTTTLAPELALLTVRQTAARLNVSEKSVRRLIAQGLPALQLGGPKSAVRVDPRRLDEWLEERGRR